MNDRHLKATAFDRAGSDYIYYENAWAKGIRVTAEEREIYLSGAHIDWLDVIYGREQTEPRRPYWRGVKRMVLAAWWGVDPDDLERERGA